MKKTRTVVTERRILIATALVGSLLAITLGWLALLRAGASLQTLSYDIPFLVHRAGAADDVRIVYIDELDGRFLDRKSQPALLDKLNEAGARAVLYDIVFDRPSEDPGTDIAFAAAMRRFRGVDEDENAIPGQPRRHVFLACWRDTFEQTGMVVEQLIPPNEELLAAADDFGLVAMTTDKSTVRELITGTLDDPSLAWQAATALGAPLKESERLAERWINYPGPPLALTGPGSSVPIQSLNAADVLLHVHPGFFRDKIVIIGGKPGIVGNEIGKDLFYTPFHRFDRRGNLPFMSGVELQANTFVNLFRGNWLTRTGSTFDHWFVVLIGLAAGACLALLRPFRGLLAAISAIAALLVAGIVSIHFGKIWFPWSVAAFLQIPAAFVWGTASRFYVEKFFRAKLTAERQRIREAFAKYLSPQMLERLAAEGFKLDQGGENARVAMMFTDLESFTDMCDRIRDPQRIVATLNDYFERTTGHIFDDDGVIIKFIGDAIFAAWGAPVPDPDAPRKAVRAAWKLFQSDKLVVDGESLETRIGLHFGDVVAGNIGSKRRVDYTMVGDAVNLAARLEGLNKLIGTRILMSDAVRENIGDEFRTRRVGRFRVKGRKEATIVHELLGPARQQEIPEWIAVYHQAVEALEAGDRETARGHFAAAAALRGPDGDGPSHFFLQAVEEGIVTAEGIVEMKEK